MGALADRVATTAETRVGVAMPYLHTLADASSAAFAKWMLAMPAAAHRSAAPKEAWHLARLGATVAQDCGTCVQVIVTVARDDGVGAGLLRQALDDPDGLYDDLREAYAFGRAVATGAPDAADHARAIEDLFGHAVHVELAMAVAMCHIFPVIKRGLGQALACSLVTIDI